jgi:hypothetical protein
MTGATGYGSPRRHDEVRPRWRRDDHVPIGTCDEAGPSRPGRRPSERRWGNATVPSDNCPVPKTKYEVNPAAVQRARELIDARQYVLNSDWGQVQPSADAQNRYLQSHSWDEYAQWHLALTTGVPGERKARYAFVFGDFRRLHRSGLIACVYRASEWRHKSVELAAHDLLQYLDAKTM